MTFRLVHFIKTLATGMSLTAAVVANASAAQPNPHPTIRAMSGVGTLDHLDPKTTALIVIDFQKEYSTGKMPIPDGAKAAENAKKLIAFADQNKMPVFQVQHVTPAGSAVFAVDGDTVKFQPGMEPRANDILVKKDTVSVFSSANSFKPELDKQLKAKGIKTVVIAGLMTHACVAGAARDAAPLGYNVVVASDASATRDITRANGDKVNKDDLHRAALAEVEDTFGYVMKTAEIERLPLR